MMVPGPARDHTREGEPPRAGRRPAWASKVTEMPGPAWRIRASGWSDRVWPRR